jgi:cytochrome c oxidase accessory protein FixG
MLFDIIERRFIVFGTAFGPHDFYLFVLGMIALIVFIILFTVILGRLFCGWICPQTVFMEMIFRRIDYWIEGGHHQQRRLNEAPWRADKIRKKFAKYAIYSVLSFLIGNVLLAWIIGADNVIQIATDSPSKHLSGLMAMIVFSALLYWVFSWFREQACILVCPYGRLQGVLLDRNSIVISYDFTRGEPRGKMRRGKAHITGDCIDCHLCVDVCPTGIDIRNGTQLECINCAACIDACNEVMEKVQKPKGLIRYDSAEGIVNQSKFRWTVKPISYAVLLLLLVGVLTILLATRKEVDITILRTPGMFYQEQPDGRVGNVYDIKILNKAFVPVTIGVQLQNIPGEVRIIREGLIVGPQEVSEGKLLVILDRRTLHGMSTPLELNIIAGNTHLETLTTTFLGPGRRK